MWNSYHKLLIKILGLKAQDNGLSIILWLVMNAFLFNIISPLTSHVEHCHLTLAQTSESLKIGQAVNSLSSE
jgi:hypothetical protein